MVNVLYALVVIFFFVSRYSSAANIARTLSSRLIYLKSSGHRLCCSIAKCSIEPLSISEGTDLNCNSLEDLQ
jgi:hypothetical protein